MVRSREPTGQPGAGIRDVRGQLGQVVRSQDTQGPGTDRFSLVLPDAALQDMDRRPMREVVSCGGNRGRRGRNLVFQRFNGLTKSLLFFPDDTLGLSLKSLDLAADLVAFRLPDLVGAPGVEGEVVLLGGRQVSLKPVVVFLGDRLQLVVVASRATEGQTEERGPDDVGTLGQDLVAAQDDVRIAGIAAHRAESVEDRSCLALAIPRPDFIAGELLDHEPVEGR